MKKDKKQFKVVNVCGFFYSGSSAVVDLLKEFDGYYSFDEEFRLLTGPNGILEMENKIKDPKLSSKQAVEDFLQMALRQSKITFLTQIKSILKSLSSYLSYIGAKNIVHIIPRYYMRLTGQQFFSLKERGYAKKLGRNFRKITFSYVRQLKERQNEFVKITRNYLSKVLQLIDYSTSITVNTVIFDQAIPPYYPQLSKGHNYFENIKTIIVDREPGDQYVEGKEIFPNIAIREGLEFENKLEAFIKWRQYVQEKTFAEKDAPDKILRIRFEDLIDKYEKTLKQILNFLNENEEIHKNKKKYFNPKASKKNIGLYKRYNNPGAIQKIEEILY
ncbi:MAG: sulfotransferase [Elusimicrobiota bacterium]